ncbi:MAG TPA: Yip1 family protein [Paracoccaceae bacterium]|nr:Yip1 family protein [Paracoccaceae bacterium]
MTGRDVKALILETLRDPQAAARRIIAVDLPPQAGWLGLALVSVLALLMLRMTLMAFGGDEMLNPAGLAMRHPLWGAVFQAGFVLLTACGMAWAGRMFGGNGRFQDALFLVVWLQFILVLVSAVQFVALLILPPVGGIIALLSIPLFLWLLVSFTAALHGFSNLLLVLLGLIGAFFATAILVAILLTFAGIDPQLFAPV